MTAASPLPFRGFHLCESLLRHSPQQLDRFLQRVLDWQATALMTVVPYGWRRYEDTLRNFSEKHGVRLIQILHSSLAFGESLEPEDFARDRQGRPHTPSLANETWLCPSRPDTQARFRHGARQYLQTHTRPGDELLFAPADGEAVCQCPACHDRSASDQWGTFFRIAAEEAMALGDRHLHFIAYVGRFAPPTDPQVLEHVRSVCFDLHRRYRWAALNEDHPMGLCEPLTAVQDPRAADQPINRYLLDRIAEWRKAFAGELYLFENLMLQGTLSCPQPNTGALLADQAIARQMGIEGLMYEAFEPGIASFTDQIDALAHGWMGQSSGHAPSPLESACRGLPDPPVVRARVMPYLLTDRFDGLALLAEHQPDPRLAPYARELASFLAAPTPRGWQQVMVPVMAHQERFDWIYIGFRLASYVPREQWPATVPAPVAAFLATRKPWDLQETMADPIEAMRASITWLQTCTLP